jgi:hypothetical protein
MAIKGLFHVSYKSFNRFCLHSILNFSFQSYWSVIESGLHKLKSGLFLISHYKVHSSTLCIPNPTTHSNIRNKIFAIFYRRKYSLLLIENISQISATK